MFDEDKIDRDASGGVATIVTAALLVVLLFFIVLAVRGCGQKCYADEVLTGKCGWYSKDDPTDPWEHKLNADGSRFDECAFTCAMRSRAFGKYYRITNLANGSSCVVKHVDFGPALKYKGKQLNRVCDLSMAAFDRIADLDTGVITIKIEEVENGCYKL